MLLNYAGYIHTCTYTVQGLFDSRTCIYKQFQSFSSKIASENSRYSPLLESAGRQLQMAG